MADNSTTQVGNLVRDPELRFLASGMAVANFGIAVNNRRKVAGTDQWEDNPSFFDVTAYGSLAENLAESLSKGTRVVVTGRLEQRSWETTEGDKRSKVEIIADEVGPSLRWATAEVTRTEKKDAPANGRSARPAQLPGRVPQSASRQPARDGMPAAEYDTEPF